MRKRILMLTFAMLLMLNTNASARRVIQRIVPHRATDETTAFQGTDQGDLVSNVLDPDYDPALFIGGDTVYSSAISVFDMTDTAWALAIHGIETGGEVYQVSWEVSYDGGTNFVSPVEIVSEVTESTYVNFTGVRADYIRFKVLCNKDTYATIEFIYQAGN